MFDPKCHELADHFLPESVGERFRDELAQAIQDAVEMWFQSLEGSANVAASGRSIRRRESLLSEEQQS
jgi:hypothetical protein